MMHIWCKDHHQRNTAEYGLCLECYNLLAYAGQRLLKCPYGEDKPACTKCPIHCYKREKKEQVRAVMRYSGPRMLWRHPVQALLHMVDKLRKVEHPLALRRNKHEAPSLPDNPAITPSMPDTIRLSDSTGRKDPNSG